MTTLTGKTGNDERGLLPYPVIIAATKGEPQAMNIVCQHYVGYIAHLCPILQSIFLDLKRRAFYI